MSRKKKDRQIWQHRFNLSSDNREDELLHEFLDALAESDEASEWIRETLAAALRQKDKRSTTVVPSENGVEYD